MAPRLHACTFSMLEICDCVRPSASWMGLSIDSMASLALLERMCCPQLRLAQVLVRELQKHLTVATQGCACQAVEGDGESSWARSSALLRSCSSNSVGLQPRTGIFQLEPESLLSAGGAQSHHQPAEDEADAHGECNPDPEGIHCHDGDATPFSHPISSAG